MKHIAPSLLLLMTLALAGCSALQSHTAKMSAAQTGTEQGAGLDAALSRLDTSFSADDKKGLLYNLERGELLRMHQKYSESTESFLRADQFVAQLEEAAKGRDKAASLAAASLISERLKTYEGQDYEKVMLSTRLALNRMAANEWDVARVDIKRTHEREALIAELHAKEVVKAEEAAKANGVQASGNVLDGYPVETLNDPAVLQLKNGYQNALSHYLSGFMYEVMNEQGLAAPGYRKAIELKPGNQILEEGLRGLTQRSSQRRQQRMTDVLFLVEEGSAPQRRNDTFSMTIPNKRGGTQTVKVQYPVITPSQNPIVSSFQVGSTRLKLESVIDFNVMARRALRDEMPGVLLRTATRTVAKSLAVEQSNRLGQWGSMMVATAAALTEQPDDRMWLTLPERVYVARGFLPPGEHQVSVGQFTGKVSVSGQYAVVPLRVYANTVLPGTTASFGRLPNEMPAGRPAPR